jgi:outer membrane protein assembly factor BamA
VRAGMEALKKLYFTKGYIDFTSELDTDLDDDLQRIALTMKLAEEKPFRVSKVDIAGISPSLESELRAVLVPGQIFNGAALETFYDRNASVLPFHFGDATQFLRDVKTSTVDLLFDFRPCPSH